MCIWRLTIFGRPGEEFFLRQAAKVSAAPLRMTFERGSFCSCESNFRYEFKEHLTFDDFWPPCWGFFFKESREGIGHAIGHEFWTRVCLQLWISFRFWISWAFAVLLFLAVLLIHFLFRQAAKVSTASLGMTFARESFCRCKFNFRSEFNGHLPIDYFWPPCWGIFFKESGEDIGRAIRHEFWTRIFSQLRI